MFNEQQQDDAATQCSLRSSLLKRSPPCSLFRSPGRRNALKHGVVATPNIKEYSHGCFVLERSGDDCGDSKFVQ